MARPPVMRRALQLGSLLLLLATVPGRAVEPLRLTHGIASGDVTATSAVIWARASREARMSVEYTPVSAGRSPASPGRTWTPSATSRVPSFSTA